MGAAGTNRKTILVVEDDVIIREGLTTVLGRAGYQIIPAANGREALDRLREKPVDLILLDMMLPVLDGWRFLERRRRDQEPLPAPVLVVTGFEEGSLEWAVALGAAGYLRKPVAIETLLAEVERCCARPQRR
jgi:CheY-like chemotaxis protein